MTDYVFGEWLPDQPDRGNPGLTECQNVLPVAGGYAPFPSSSTFSSAMAETARGAWAGYDSAGQSRVIIGTQSKLYELTSPTPDDISGMNYSLASGAWWQFTRFGETLYATNGLNLIQKYEFSADAAFSSLGFVEPKGRQLATAKNFLVVGNTTESNGTQNSQRVWWSAIGEPTNFPTPGGTEANEKQSGYQDLNDPEGGWIQGMFGGDDLTIFLEHSIWKALYIGGNFVWQFTKVEEKRGLYLENCAVRVGTNIYFLDETGFFVLTPGGVKPIGYGKVDKYFWDNVNSTYFNLVHASADYNNKCLLWAYVDANSGASTPDRALCYNWETGRWSRIHLSGTPVLFYSSTTGYTLEELDVFGDLDSLPASLDSRFFSGGIGVFSGVNSSNQVIRFNSTAKAARIETAEQEIFNGRRALITGARPVFSGSPTLTVQIGKRALASGSVTYGSSHSVNTTTGWHDMREEGRFMRIRLDTTGGFGHLIGVDITAVEGAGR